MRFFLIALLVLFIGCNKGNYPISEGTKSDYPIREGFKSDYIHLLRARCHVETEEEINDKVIVTAYRIEIHSINGLVRKKGIISRFRIDKTTKEECDKEWREDLKKLTISPY